MQRLFKPIIKSKFVEAEKKDIIANDIKRKLDSSIDKDIFWDFIDGTWISMKYSFNLDDD